MDIFVWQRFFDILHDSDRRKRAKEVAVEEEVERARYESIAKSSRMFEKIGNVLCDPSVSTACCAENSFHNAFIAPSITFSVRWNLCRVAAIISASQIDTAPMESVEFVKTNVNYIHRTCA